MSGKDGGWILPTVIDPERVCVKLFIPNDPAHLAAFWGALWNLTYWNQWQRDDLKLGTQVAAVWKDVWLSAVALNTGMEGCEIVPFDVRQNEENPCILEKTEDDGASWDAWANLQLCPPKLVLVDGIPYWENPDGTLIPIPGAGAQPVTPRPIPPRGGSADENRCIAAANAVNTLLTLHAEVASKISVPNGFMLATTIASLLIAMLFIPFSAIVILGIMSSGALVIFAALTYGDFSEEVQDDLRCILYCAAEDDGGVVTFDFSEVKAGVGENIAPLNIWAAIDKYLDIIAEGGLNLAGATTAVTEAECDCPDCPTEWCYEWDQTAFEADWQFIFGSSQGTRFVYADIGFTSTITHVEFEWAWNGLGAGGSSGRAMWLGENFGFLLFNDSDITTLASIWDGSEETTGFTIGVNADSGSGGILTINRVMMRGIGENPFGEDNCEE